MVRFEFEPSIEATLLSAVTHLELAFEKQANDLPQRQSIAGLELRREPDVPRRAVALAGKTSHRRGLRTGFACLRADCRYTCPAVHRHRIGAEEIAAWRKGWLAMGWEQYAGLVEERSIGTRPAMTAKASRKGARKGLSPRFHGQAAPR